MSDTSQTILEAALALSESERAELAARVADSIGEGRSDEENDAAWLAEAKLRLEAVRAGRARLIPSEEVERELEEIVGAPETRRAG